MTELINFLNKSKTQYHAVKNAKQILESAGFTRLFESEPFDIKKGGKYFVERDGSAIIAFTVAGDANLFKIVASHTDSPCFKVKFGKAMLSPAAGTTSLYVEKYGGGLLYSWFDRPLKLAGRLCGEVDGKVKFSLFESDARYCIPSVAIHFKRNANDGFSVNPQTDCPPLYALSGDSELLKNELEKSFDGKLLDCDLYAVCDETPFVYGLNGEFLCSPRIDDLASGYASILSLTEADSSQGVSVAYLADNEEVGSRTKQGAASPFLKDVLKRIFFALNDGLSEADFMQALSKSFLISCDNAHATHPNHPELADRTADVKLGGGIVIKHHGNQNYTTDGMSSAILKSILNGANVPYCDYYQRSDLPCGGTLGAISSSQAAVRSVDIGIPQLAMHSACETLALIDFKHMKNGLKAFYENYVFCGENK